MTRKKKKQKWTVTITVVNDISWCHGTLTKLIPRARIKRIIEDAMEDVNWRDIDVKKITVKKS